VNVLVALPVLALMAFAEGPAIGRIALVGDVVEVQSGRSWKPVVEGSPLRIGDKLRTGQAGNAQLELPWMTLKLSGSSRLTVRDSRVLALVLEEGRVEELSTEGELIKLLTEEASIRGRGHVVVRRIQGRSLVSALAGSFRVEANGKAVELAAGEGTVVSGRGGPRAAARLPAAPLELQPGDDPQYVNVGEPVTLRFVSTTRAHRLELLPLDSSQLVMEQDVVEAPARITVPWPGTFRWRLSARDAEGLEGLPSTDGWLVVVAK
jgi:hypothetical protein